MQPSALRALEFDRIVGAVTAFALTPLGAERLSRLQPSTDPQQVAQWQAATTETARFVAAHGVFPLRASSELPQILAALAVEGRAHPADEVVVGFGSGPEVEAAMARARAEVANKGGLCAVEYQVILLPTRAR